jgi:hypothetical protein
VTCSEYREELLDTIGQEHTAPVKDHLFACVECRRFQETHLELHTRFLVASAENLSPAFRRTLRKRIAEERVFYWPDFLPDVAHLSGCVAATLVSVLVLPWPAVPVLVTCAAFTGITYLLQAKLRDALQGETLW